MTPEELELVRKWDAILKKDGFKDVEITDYTNGQRGNLLKGMSHMDMLRTYTPEKERYYQLAQQWYHHHLAIRPTDVRVRASWWLHSQGWSMADIGIALGVNRQRISDWINVEKASMLDAVKHGRAFEETEGLEDGIN